MFYGAAASTHPPHPSGWKKKCLYERVVDLSIKKKVVPSSERGIKQRIQVNVPSELL